MNFTVNKNGDLERSSKDSLTTVTIHVTAEMLPRKPLECGQEVCLRIAPFSMGGRIEGELIGKFFVLAALGAEFGDEKNLIHLRRVWTKPAPAVFDQEYYPVQVMEEEFLSRDLFDDEEQMPAVGDFYRVWVEVV